MDYLCGRLVYYDEIPNDFASAENDRIEYWKSITVRGWHPLQIAAPLLTRTIAPLVRRWNSGS